MTGKTEPNQTGSLGMVRENRWQPIETLPEFTDALVCVTHNVPGESGMKWETVMWVDWWCEANGWYDFPKLIHIPFPPTHWMPLPPAPEAAHDL